MRKKIGDVWCDVRVFEAAVVIKLWRWGEAESAWKLVSINNFLYFLSRSKEEFGNRDGGLEEAIEYLVNTYKASYARMD